MRIRLKPSALQRWITWGLQAVMFVGLLLTVYEQQWLNAFLIACIILLALLPSVLSRRFNVYVPPEFELLALVFVFSSLFLGEIRGYYVRFWWWDAALHMGSGFLLGIVGFLLVYVMNQSESVELHMKPAFVALFSFMFALGVGALWEVFEYAMDTFFGLNMQKSGLRDTMWDLIVDAVGAFVMASIGFLYMRWGRESLVFRWIGAFVEGNPHLFERVEEEADVAAER